MIAGCRSLRRSIAFLFLLCAVCSIASAQGLLSVYNVDASAFPTVKAKFVALDSRGNQLRGLAPSDFTVTENGIPRTVTKVSCPPEKPVDPLSVGVMVDTYGYLDLAAAGTRKLIDLLKMPPSELGITTMDQGVFIVQDLTMDRAKATSATTKIISSPGTHLQRIFYDQNAGGVPFISGRPQRKALVLLTDLHCPVFDLDTARLWADAARENISVYMILFNANDYEGLFNRVAVKTGGKVFERVTTVEQVEKIFEEIVIRTQHEPCELEWTSAMSCNPTRATTLMINSNLQTVDSYVAPAQSLAALDIQPSILRLGGVEPGIVHDTTIVLTARGTAIRIDSITIDNPAFLITNGNAPPSFTLQPGESRTITIRFSPSDSSYNFGRCYVHTDICDGAILYLLGGFPGHIPQQPTLKLIYPNGGEQLIVGDTAIIIWTGNLPTDRMTLQFSTDAGSTWKEITAGMRGMKYFWKVPNTPSNTCLMRVTQLLGKATMMQINGHGSYIYSSVFSPNGNTILTAGSNTAKVWDAQTGNLIYVFPSTRGVMMGAIYSPDGLKIATADEYGGLQIWDANTGSLLHTIETRHTALRPAIRPDALDFSPDGKLLATGGWDSVKVWDVATGSLVTGFYPGPGAQAHCVRFIPNRQELIVSAGTGLGTGSSQGSLSFWNYQTSTLTKRIDRAGVYNSMNFNRSGDRMVISDATTWIRVLSDTLGFISVLKGTLGMGGVRYARFNPASDLVISASYDQFARIWDINTSQVIDSLPNDTAYLLPSVTTTTACFSTKDQRIVTTHDNGLIRIWDFVPFQQDISDSLWSIIAPELTVVVPEVDMKDVLVGADRDSLVTAVLCNRGTAPVHVLGIDATSGATEDFMVMSGGGDFTLAPGECRDITFTFMPMIAGPLEARFTVRTTIDTLRDAIHVFGNGVEQQLQVATELVDFGKVNVGGVKDSSVAVMLKNIGTAPITINGTSKFGPDTTQFSITAGGTSVVLAPGDVYPLSLRFSPDRVGKTSGRVAFHYNGVGSPATASLFGEGVGAELLATAVSVPYDTLICQTSRDTLIDIYNSGNADLVISNATLAGADAGDFLLNWTSQGSNWPAIARGEHASATVTFRPQSPGEKNASLVLTTNALNAGSGDITIPLRGRKDSAGYELSKSTVSFTELPINASATDTVTLTNTGTLPLVWQAPITIGGFTIESILPATTLPGESSKIIVRYNGGAEGRVADESLLLPDGYCNSQQSLTLKATVRFNSLGELAIPDVNAAPGDAVEIPIFLRNARFIQQSHATAFESSLRYNATLLIPEAPTPAGTIVNGERIIPLVLPIASGDTLLRLRFRAALGNDSTTLLQLEHSTAIGGTVTLTESAGRFTLTGLCREGGTRLLNVEGTIALKPVRPNPAFGAMEIEYEVIEEGRTELYLTDMLGRRVATLVNDKLVPGRYITQWEAQDQTSGIFFCILQTPTKRLMQMVEVRK